MLSIGAMGHSQGHYYINLAREDYYTAGGEPPGQWRGQGALFLGRTGPVEQQYFKALLKGYGPDGKTPLIRNAGAPNHQPGWDLTFSAPKSVSVLWSQAGEETRRQIQQAQAEAVQTARHYLEESAAFTRRGQGGTEWERAGLMVATFEHGTSRAQDPQLHTHALVFNVTSRADGTTGTLVSKTLYRHKMTAGALYRAELAKQLEQRLGVNVERTGWRGHFFEVQGVSEELIQFFSKRRQEIEAALRTKGLESAAAAATATLETREAKEHVAREVLFELWRKEGLRHGFSWAQVEALLGQPLPDRNPAEEKRPVFQAALSQLEEEQSYFTEQELLRRTAELAPGTGLGVADLRAEVGERLEIDRGIVRLGEYGREPYYATHENLQLEKALLQRAEETRGWMHHLVSRETLEWVQKRYPELRPQQKQALEHITRQSGGIQVVSGVAGSGKTYMLQAARKAWEREGYRVCGAALAGKAAEGLEEGSGIPSATLHKRFRDLGRGVLDDQKWTLTNWDVVVVDEAGMVGTRMMGRLVEETQQAGAKLVLVGDARQLQPIGPGGPFKSLADRLVPAKLTEIWRQDKMWAREAVHQFAAGDARTALAAYAQHGQLVVSENRDGARVELLRKWGEEGLKRPHDHLMLSGTRWEVELLNEAAQEGRRRAGHLGRDYFLLDNKAICEGDRVLFTRNSLFYGVKNGSLGTVTKIERGFFGTGFRARLDNGKRVRIDLKYYHQVQLGYAVTTHKAQGMTVDNAYVLLGGAMQDRELSYVQASRARKKTWLFTDQAEAGEDLAELARQMSQSHQKDLAYDVAERAEPDPAPRPWDFLPGGWSLRAVEQQMEPELALTRAQERAEPEPEPPLHQEPERVSPPPEPARPQPELVPPQPEPEPTLGHDL